MDKLIIDDRTAANILRDALANIAAEIYRDSTRSPFEVQTIELSLDSAREIGNAYKISNAFRSIFVRDATDPNVEVLLSPSTADSYQSPVPLRYNDSLDLGRQLSGAFITWKAQPGKKVTLLVFVSSFFRSGSQVSLTSGGVSVSDGNSAIDSCVSVTGTVVQQIFSNDTTRKKGTIQNRTGGSIYIGPLNTVSNAGATAGFELKPGDVFFWRNTAALYCYPTATLANSLFLREEF